MRKVFLSYFLCFYLIEIVITSRIRLCVQTNNQDKLPQQCVFCQSRQLKATLELCTGSQEYSVNITYEQANCLINICNRNQLPTDLQQSQFIETVNTKTSPTNFMGKYTRPMASKQQLLHQQLNTAEMNNLADLNNLNSNLNNNLDQQQLENMNNDLNNNGLSSTSNELMLNEQSNDLMSRPISDQTSLNTMNANMMNSNTMNPSTNWIMQTTSPIPTNNKLIFKRKPFKFRIWPYFFG